MVKDIARKIYKPNHRGDKGAYQYRPVTVQTGK